MGLVAHKSFIGEVTRAEEDGKIFMFGNEVPVSKGELILTDLNGNQQLITETSFNEYYVPVTVKKPKRKVSKSPFEESLEEAYKQAWAGNEDEKYINVTRELSLINNKAL